MQSATKQPARAKKPSSRPGWDSSPAGKAAIKSRRPTSSGSSSLQPAAAVKSPTKPGQRERPWSAASTASAAGVKKQRVSGAAAAAAASKENDAQNQSDRSACMSEPSDMVS